MATYQEIEQVQAFSRVDGAVVALFWIVSFLFFVGNFSNPLLGLISFTIGAVSLVYAALRLRKFRDNVLDGSISFWRAYGYSTMTYLYAALLFAAAQFIYFQFIDHGYLMNQYSAIAQTKEFVEMMKIYGITPEDLKIGMENIAALRPIEIALQFFSLNVMMGVFVSLPVAAIMRKKKRIIKH
ncbi:MAG: DUF4199 domain-containing protein [Prevotella sp.]|nr:DUF4199 domain-containing protein [Prevotella sp.]